MAPGGSVIFVKYASPNEIIAAGTVLPVLGIATVLLRFYVRNSRKQKMGVDDWLVLPAMFFVIGMGACMVAGVQKRVFGYNTPPPVGSSREELLTHINREIHIEQQIEFAFSLLMIQSYCWIKLSIVFFYRKLLVANKGMFSHFTWALIAIIIAWTVTFTFSIIFSCGTHFQAHWGSRLDLITYCPDGLKRQEGLYVTEFITNVLLIILPLPTVWSLHTTVKRKFAVTCILLLAFMAFAASIIRLVMLLQVVTTPAAYAAKVDENQTITTILYWGMIEAGLALIACSLPMLKPLISEHGIQSAVNSVRSAISLHSITRSNGSTGSKGGSKASKASNNYSKLEPGAPDMAPLRGDRTAEGTSSAAQSSYHLDEPKPIVEAGKIRIQRDVDVTNSRA